MRNILILFFVVMAGCGAEPRADAQPASPPAPTPAATPAVTGPTWTGTRTVFQYAATVAKADGKEATAYLWLPPGTTRVRGLLIGGTVLFEGAFASHPAIRTACARADLGIVLFSPHLDAVFDAAKSAGPLQAALDALAGVSGHPELASAPLLPFGHSVGTIWTRNLVFWKPERMLGGIFFKGGFGVPEGRSIDDIAGIPLIHVQGRFEEFGPGPDGKLRTSQGEDRSTGARTAQAQLAALRLATPAFLMGLLLEDGSTHFILNDRVADVLASYVAGAVALRLPPGAEAPRAVAVEAGVVSPQAAQVVAAEPTAGFWYPDPATAAAADALHRNSGKAPQYVSVADASGKPVKIGHDMRLRVPPAWTAPGAFRIAGAFWDARPDLYPDEGPARQSADPPQVRIFAGPLMQTGPDTFAVTLDTRLGDRPFIAVWHPGDGERRWAEQPVNVRAPIPLKDGAPQALTVPALGRIRAADLPMRLEGSSDSGLPVSFHVDHGPARVVDGRLELADVPAGAPQPYRIVLVAWQYGSATPPKFASAAQRQTIEIVP